MILLFWWFFLLAQPFPKTGSDLNWFSRILKTTTLIVKKKKKKLILGLGTEFSQLVCSFWFVSHIIWVHTLFIVRNDSKPMFFSSSLKVPQASFVLIYHCSKQCWSDIYWGPKKMNRKRLTWKPTVLILTLKVVFVFSSLTWYESWLNIFWALWKLVILGTEDISISGLVTKKSWSILFET